MGSNADTPMATLQNGAEVRAARKTNPNLDDNTDGGAKWPRTIKTLHKQRDGA